MTFRPLENLLRLEGVHVFPGASDLALERLQQTFELTIPEDHRSLLKETDGCETYCGYARLFGAESGSRMNLVEWNSKEYWKFAWKGRAAEYLCFAETAWGDQYAYKYADLRTEREDIYFLECLSMTATPLASSFADFFENEFIPAAVAPYDKLTVAARERFGALVENEHLVHVPSILISGEENIASVQKLNSRWAMIINGDIALQLDEAPEGKTLKAVVPYEDTGARMRVRLEWE